jgi:CheY-like chemotaxis protein
MSEPDTTPEALTPARRLELLRGILNGRYSLSNGSSDESQTPSPQIMSTSRRPGGDRAPDTASVLEFAPSSGPAGHDGADAATRHILVVDDEHFVLALTSRILRNAGYGVLEASSAREALRLFRRQDPPIDLVITDVRMPEIDGRMLGRLLAERYPCLPVAYMSAYSINDVFHRGSPGPNLPFLSKPFSPETLLALVKTVLVSERSGAHEPAETRHTGNLQRPSAEKEST